MVNTNLVNYIRTNLAKGFSIYSIKQRLLAQGVSDYEIKEAILALNRPQRLRSPPLPSGVNRRKSTLPPSKRVSRKKVNNFFWILFGIFIALLVIFLILFFTSRKPLKSNLSIEEAMLLEGVEVNLSEGSIVNFNFNSEDYSFKVDKVSEDFMDLTGDFEERLIKGDINNFDMNGDGRREISLFYEGLVDGKGVLRLEGFQDFICPENWNCTSWGSCINGERHRLCVDLNSCGTDFEKPSLVETCGDNSSSGPDVVGVSIGKVLDCGIAYPDNVSKENISVGDGIKVISNFEEDNSLVCFGNNLISGCGSAKLILRDGKGSEELMESSVVEGGNCSIRYEILRESSDEPGSEGTS